MRHTAPLSDLQRRRIIALHSERARVQAQLDLFCDAILTGIGVDNARVIDMSADGLVYETDNLTPADAMTP